MQNSSFENISRPDRVAFSIVEFCYRNDISLSTYHKLKRENLGPAEMRLGTAIRISIEEEIKWRAARSNPRGAEAEAKAVAKLRAIEHGRKAAQLSVQSPRHIANVKRATRAEA